MHTVRRVFGIAILSFALGACIYKSEMKWETESDDKGGAAANRRATPDRLKGETRWEASASRAMPKRATVVAKTAPQPRGVCARALIAVREPQSTTGAWGRTEIVTFVEMEAVGVCPHDDAAPTDAKHRKALAMARSLPLKAGSVVLLEEATDWALGTDDGGNTWRSRTFTVVVEKRRAR